MKVLQKDKQNKYGTSKQRRTTQQPTTQKKINPEISYFQTESLSNRSQLIQLMKQDAQDRLILSKIKKNIQQLCKINEEYRKKLDQSQYTYYKNKQYMQKLQKTLEEQKRGKIKKKVDKDIQQEVRIKHQNQCLTKIINQLQPLSESKRINTEKSEPKSQIIQVQLNLANQLSNNDRFMQLTVNPNVTNWKIQSMQSSQQGEEEDEQLTEQQLLQIANSDSLYEILTNKEYGGILIRKLQEYQNRTNKLPLKSVQVLQQLSYLNKSEIKEQLEYLSNNLSHLDNKQ